MSVGKNLFFEIEQEKIMKIHNKYSARDENNRVHCYECPYGLSDGYHCDCLFSRQLEKVEVEE